MIEIILPWWAFLLYGVVLVWLVRFGDWLGDKAGSAASRAWRMHREKRRNDAGRGRADRRG